MSMNKEEYDDYLSESLDIYGVPGHDLSGELAHFGVLGMKWGVRNDRSEAAYSRRKGRKVARQKSKAARKQAQAAKSTGQVFKEAFVSNLKTVAITNVAFVALSKAGQPQAAKVVNAIGGVKLTANSVKVWASIGRDLQKSGGAIGDKINKGIDNSLDKSFTKKQAKEKAQTAKTTAKKVEAERQAKVEAKYGKDLEKLLDDETMGELERSIRLYKLDSQYLNKMDNNKAMQPEIDQANKQLKELGLKL